MPRPLIGLSASTSAKDPSFLTISQACMQSLLQAGALPVLLPITQDADAITAYALTLDGLLFTGGGDPDPMLFGDYQRPACGTIDPDRDRFELDIFRAMLPLNKPIAGICRGMQLINVALGGTLYQDLSTEYDKPIAHMQKQPARFPSHPVMLQKEDHPLQHIFPCGSMMVNSLHHQAVKDLGQGLKAFAHAPDGVIEGLYADNHPFLVGLQWHPEKVSQTDLYAKLFFQTFVDACNVTANLQNAGKEQE